MVSGDCLTMPSSAISPRLVWSLVWPARRRILPPSSGPTQVRTTVSWTFRALVSLGGELEEAESLPEAQVSVSTRAVMGSITSNSWRTTRLLSSRAQSE